MNKFLPRLIWALVAIVILIAIVRFVTTRPHRSADQQILINRSK